MTSKTITFVHLSDIHFTKSSGSFLDLDTDVRNELLRDAATFLKNGAAPATGVLVTGDIAFSGQKQEYERAAEWLREFCVAIRCPEENVWVVPGNHDVDRKLANDLVTRMLHERIRAKGVDEVDDGIRELLSNPQAAHALLDPLTEYNVFASRYQCSVSATKLFWERDLPLACGTVVRMRGLCSALVSNAEDERGKIILGTAQAGVKRDDGVLYLTLCHHPPDWLLDRDSVEEHMRSRVHIQLFGHKHAQRVDVINDMLRLVAGATHPERGKGDWLPTYNVLEIGRHDDDHIGLRLFQRRWDRPRTRFVADRDPENGNEYREHKWREYRSHVVKSNALAKRAVRAEAPASQPASPDDVRRLMFRFLTLPFLARFEISLNLGLLREEDDAVAREALFAEVSKRAGQAGALARLWDEIERRHKDPAEVNPFDGSGCSDAPQSPCPKPRQQALSDVLKKATTSITVHGHTLDKFTADPAVSLALSEAVQKGIAVTLILVNPNSDYARAHEPFHLLESRSPSMYQITASIEQLVRLHRLTGNSTSLKVVLTKYMPKFRAIIIDGHRAHISLYMYGTDVTDTPQIVVDRNRGGQEASWFAAIHRSTQQLLESSHVLPVISGGRVHEHWHASQHAFQLKRCLARSCCTCGENCWQGIQRALLGYQNEEAGTGAETKYRLVSSEFCPGLFNLDEIRPGAGFLAREVTFKDWLETVTNEEVRLLQKCAPQLLAGVRPSDLLCQVREAFDFKARGEGKTLRELTSYQEYSDVLHRVIMAIVADDPESAIELYRPVTIDAKAFVAEVITHLEAETSDPEDWLRISIAAGLIGIENKTVNAATSQFSQDVAIRLPEKRWTPADVRRVGEALVALARATHEIDATELFFHVLDTNALYELRLVSFPDDYIESLCLLKYYEILLRRYPRLVIDLVPKAIPCSNDLTEFHARDALALFPELDVFHKHGRFRVAGDGPRTGGVNLRKLNESIWKRVKEACIVDVRGARNYEMMQGLRKQTFFGFVVCRDFSASVTGLDPDGRSLVFMRQLPGEKSFEGFRFRHRRIDARGRMLAARTARDDAGRWSGGHLKTVQKDVLDRWNMIKAFYSNYALSFDRKWGGAEGLEDDVKGMLDRLSGRVLVLGCGTGKEVAYLKGRGGSVSEVYGLDLSAEAILIAQQRYPGFGECFFVEDFYNVRDILDGAFDAVVANASLLHVLRREDMGYILNSDFRGGVRDTRLG